MNKIKNSVWRENLCLPDIVSENHQEFISFCLSYEKTQKKLLSELNDIKIENQKQKNVSSDVLDLKSDMRSCMIKIETLTERLLPISSVDIERRMRKCSFITEEISEKSPKNCEILRKEIGATTVNGLHLQEDILISPHTKQYQWTSIHHGHLQGMPRAGLQDSR